MQCSCSSKVNTVALNIKDETLNGSVSLFWLALTFLRLFLGFQNMKNKRISAKIFPLENGQKLFDFNKDLQTLGYASACSVGDRIQCKSIFLQTFFIIFIIIISVCFSLQQHVLVYLQSGISIEAKI